MRDTLDSVLPNAEVRVFDSRATGPSRPFSNLDLLVIQPLRLSWRQRADLRDRFEASELPFCVDLVELDALPPCRVDRVANESVVLPER